MYCSINKFLKKNSIPLSLDCEKHHTSNSRSYFWISKIFTDFIYAMQKKKSVVIHSAQLHIIFILCNR